MVIVVITIINTLAKQMALGNQVVMYVFALVLLLLRNVVFNQCV
jgi:hypothetical protein